MHSWILAVFLILAPAASYAVAQPAESIASLLVRFDAEHDLTAKERLLRTLTANYPGAGPSLLKLAESTANSDTRWMAMRGMADLGYAASAPFLVAWLKNPDVFVRANAARALGDLQIATAADALLAMFAAENDPRAVQQASLALRMLDIKAGAPYVRENTGIHRADPPLADSRLRYVG